MISHCLNCGRRLAYVWWQVMQISLVGAGITQSVETPFSGSFCNPTCFAEWWKVQHAKQEGADDAAAAQAR